MSSNINVAVIGCGAIGLSSALAIQKKLSASPQRPAHVTIFAESFSPATTSDVAAGLWTPYLLQDTPPESIVKWSRTTQDYLVSLWKAGEAKQAGISLQLVIKLSAKKNYKLPEWAHISLGYCELNSVQLEFYSKKYKENFCGGFAYMAFIWEASIFLPFLSREFVRSGGKVIEKKIESFEELADEFDVIVNCAGLGAGNLCSDKKVIPVRGQVVRVDAPMQLYTLMVEREWGEGKYIIANQESVVLGGTSQVGDYNTENDRSDIEGILDGCCKYIPGLARAGIVRSEAGLRPGRDCVRLEMEVRRVGNGVVRIVHNYGHGGSGITLSVGCAEECAGLVARFLNFSKL